MGQLAFIKMFILVSISVDINDNRRHVKEVVICILRLKSKIWIEKNGHPCVEVAESSLSKKDNELLVEAISKHWDFINSQITKSFNGEKPIIKNIGD